MPAVSLVFIFYFVIIHCTAYEDGKYHPRKYNIYDDGKYYRPLDEGKYIPGDEGKYTYIYRQGLYPEYPYVHQEGPNGGSGGNGGYGGGGGTGGDGPNGPGGSGGPDGSDRPGKIEYIGRKIYAERFPYIHKVIKALIDKYVSIDSLFAEESEGSANHYTKLFADKETAVKCQYLKSKNKDEDAGFTTQYPPRPASDNGKTSGSYYSFKGTKILHNVTNSANLKSSLKLEYEVFIRIVDEVTNQ